MNMEKKPTLSQESAELRRQAEARLREKSVATGQVQTEADLRRLQHELEVHQIELEMQNEELQRAQAETMALLEKYTDLYDFAPTGYFSFDCESTILAVNLTGARLAGIERARLLNRRFEDLVLETDRPAFREFLQRTFAGEGREIVQVALLKDGTASLVVRIEAVPSREGRECRASVLDVTDRERMEQQLRKQEALLRLMIARSVEPMLLIDDTGTINCASNRAADLLGYTLNDLEGAPVTRFLYMSDQVSLKLHLDDLKKNAPRPASAMLRVYTKSGDWHWISVSVTLEDYLQGSGKYFVKFEIIPPPAHTRAAVERS